MSSRNSTAGSGRRLPTSSTTSRLRASQPRRSRVIAAGPVGEGGVFVMVCSSVGFGSRRSYVPSHPPPGGQLATVGTLGTASAPATTVPAMKSCKVRRWSLTNSAMSEAMYQIPDSVMTWLDHAGV